MDYGYSPIQNINIIPRIIEPKKEIRIIYGKRMLKTNTKKYIKKIEK